MVAVSKGATIMRAFFFILGLILVASMAQAQSLSIVPNFSLTRGAIDPSLTPSYLCSHPTSDRRNVGTALKKEVFAAYGISYEDRADYEVDHLIPLSLGGVNRCSDNPTCNLWPQPHQKSFPEIAPWGSETKDKLEARLYNTMCDRRTHTAVQD